jgi:hypothetical protein
MRWGDSTVGPTSSLPRRTTTHSLFKSTNGRAEEAMAEVLRVVKRGGRVFGQRHVAIRVVPRVPARRGREIDRFGLHEMREIFEDGLPGG